MINKLLLYFSNRKYSLFAVSIGVLMLYTLITLIVFSHRLPDITTHYGMPDVDTDGGLWYQWFLIYAKQHKLLTDFIILEGFPFGYDASLSPISNLIYSVHIFILEHIIGYNWSNLIFITNASSLITYPLSAIGAFLLSYYLTKNKAGSFVAGLIFAFSFYHVYMGRGQMSINHIEFIPFYFLSLFYFLDKRSVFLLILSSVIFSLMFMADAYYAFFSGIFSVLVILLYKQESLSKKIVTLLTYYSVLLVTFFLINFNFVLSNLYLFDKAQAAATGRNSIPRNELTGILYYFSPLSFNFIYDRAQYISYFLYNIPLYLALAGIIFLRKKRLYMLFLLCFIIAILLSAYVPILYWLNLLYFKYFGMFRGVGRLALPGYLFFGLLVSMVIADFMKTKYYMQINKKLFLTFLTTYFVLCLIIVITSLNTDATWYKRTDFSQLAKVYGPIRADNDIQVMAVYPFDLNFQDTGFPQPYQLLGQIVHNKTLANGATIGSKQAAYQAKIRDLTKKDSITNLQKYGVDTILIYNKLLENAPEINKMLTQDQRLMFVGTYKGAYEEGYISSNQLSRDVSVYKIKATNKEKKPLFYTQEGNKVTYKQISEGKYIVTIKDVKKQTNLIYTYPFSEKWKLYEGNLQQTPDFTFLNKKEATNIKHETFNEYLHKWIISGRQGDVQLTVFWQPNARNHLGSFISNTALAIVGLYLILYLIRKLYSLYFKKK